MKQSEWDAAADHLLEQVEGLGDTDAAKRLKLHESTVYRWREKRKAGKSIGTPRGGPRRVLAEAMQRLTAGSETAHSLSDQERAELADLIDAAMKALGVARQRVRGKAISSDAETLALSGTSRESLDRAKELGAEPPEQKPGDSAQGEDESESGRARDKE